MPQGDDERVKTVKLSLDEEIKNRLVVSKLSPTWRLENMFLFRVVIAYSMYSILAFCIQIGCLLHAVFSGRYYFSTEQSLSSWVIMSRKYLQLWDFSHSISISAQFEKCTPHFDLWKRSVSYENTCELHYVSKKTLGLLKVKPVFHFLVAFIIE